MFDEDFGAEPTVAIQRETKHELMARDIRRHDHAVPVRPASLTETREIEIPPEMIALTE